MIKMLLNACCIALLIPFSVLAISINEIQDNPTKFVPIHSTPVISIYVNADSLKVVRYNPPFYNIEGTYYFVDFQSQMIIESTVAINYDYSKSFDARYRDAFAANPYAEQDYLRDIIVSQLEADSGLVAGDEYAQCFDFSGTLIIPKEKVKSRFGLSPIPFDNMLWYIGNYFFYKCYDINFTGMPITTVVH